MTSRGRLLLRAQRPGKPLGPPPADADADEAQAWRDIIAAVPGDIFRAEDRQTLAHVATFLAAWRRGGMAPGATRALYRWFGEFLMPMAARRALLFPQAKPSRSRRV